MSLIHFLAFNLKPTLGLGGGGGGGGLIAQVPDISVEQGLSMMTAALVAIIKYLASYHCS